MLIEGLKITLLGMGTVFAFLSLMVYCLYLLSKIPGLNDLSKGGSSGEDENIPAVLAAAIARFKKNKTK